jgi:serine/threonine protein kinase
MSINNYDIIKKPIGHGSFGFVKKGTSKLDNKQVAIKYLKYEKKEELNQFLKEVNIFF